MLHGDARAIFLTQRAGSPEDIQAYLISQLQRDGAVRRSGLLRKSRFSDEEISAAISRFIANGEIAAIGEFVAAAAKWNSLRRRASEAIDEWHRAHSEKAGMALTDLQARLEADLPSSELFDGLVSELTQRDFVRAGAVIRRVSHRPALTPALQAVASKLRADLAAKPYDPPSRNQLAPDPIAQQALRFLIKAGEAIEIDEEVVMAAEHFKRATDLIREFIRARGPATVSDLRQMLGSTRRVTLPLLVRMDRDGVTSRQGDKRILRQ